MQGLSERISAPSDLKTEISKQLSLHVLIYCDIYFSKEGHYIITELAKQSAAGHKSIPKLTSKFTLNLLFFLVISIHVQYYLVYPDSLNVSLPLHMLDPNS